MYKIKKLKWQESKESVCFGRVHCESFCWGYARTKQCTQIQLGLIAPKFVYKYHEGTNESYLSEKTFCSRVCLDDYLDSLIDRRVTSFLYYPGILWLIGIILTLILWLTTKPLLLLIYILGGLIGIPLLGGILVVILNLTISIKEINN